MIIPAYATTGEHEPELSEIWVVHYDKIAGLSVLIDTGNRLKDSVSRVFVLSCEAEASERMSPEYIVVIFKEGHSGEETMWRNTEAGHRGEFRIILIE